MPKTFSEQERSIIKKSMYSITSALIRKKGLRQVTVEDVTKEANIVKGSFYSFYNSREELLWDTVKLEEKHLIDQIFVIAKQELDLKAKIRKIIYDVYLQKDSIVFYLPPEDTEYVIRKLPCELLQSNENNSYNFNQSLLFALQLTPDQERIDVLRTMEDLLLAAASSKVPGTEAAHQKVLGILVEALADYLSETDTSKSGQK